MVVIDERFETRDVDAAETFLQRMYPATRIQDPEGAFALRQRIRGTEQVQVVQFAYSSRLELDVEIDRLLPIGVSSAGQARYASNGLEADPGEPFLFRPGTAKAWVRDLALLTVNFDLAALHRFAAAAVGVDEVALHYDGVAPLSEALGVHWRRTATWLCTVVGDPEVFASDLARSTAFTAATGAALAAFPIRVVARSSPDGIREPPALGRALRFIDEHAHEPITVPDIAAAAHLSIRALQERFRAALDVTPSAHLAAVRLAGARRDLLAADPATTSVAAIARRWGFGHLGRFAALHRRAFGENPSQALER